MTTTVLIAAGDAALVDSLRYAHETEGYAVLVECAPDRLAAAGSGAPATCLVIDHSFLAALMAADAEALRRLGLPTILMAGNVSLDWLARAIAAGVSSVVEKPILGGLLLDAVRNAVAGAGVQTRPRA